MIIRGFNPPPPTVYQHSPLQMSVDAGSVLIGSREVQWCKRWFELEGNPSWFKHRVDTIVIDVDYGPVVVKGTPALWSQVAPECEEDQVPISTVTVLSRFSTFLARFKR